MKKTIKDFIGFSFTFTGEDEIYPISGFEKENSKDYVGQKCVPFMYIGNEGFGRTFDCRFEDGTEAVVHEDNLKA